MLSSIQTLGLGKSLYQAQTDNWWEHAFDNSLKSLTVSQSTDGDIRVVQEDVKGGGIGLNQVVKLGKGKYVGCIKFVKGGFLEGTLRQSSTVQVTGMGEKVVEDGECTERRERKRKRKRGEEVEGSLTKAEESRVERKKKRKEEKAAKEERRRLRREKKMGKLRIHADQKQKKTESNSGLKLTGVDPEPSNIIVPPPPAKEKEKQIERMPNKSPSPTPLISNERANTSSNGISESEVKLTVKEAKKRKGRRKAVEKGILIDSSTRPLQQ